MSTDPNENPQTSDLEAAVKHAGLWDRYQDFILVMTETAKIKFAHLPKENHEAFIKTCKYSYCAGVNEAFLKIYEDFNLDEDKRH